MAKQDDLALTLTKVSINDEHPDRTQLVHITSMPQDAGDFFPAVAKLS